jgi:glyoxylate/hydroxypyruvate reductase
MRSIVLDSPLRGVHELRGVLRAQPPGCHVNVFDAEPLPAEHAFRSHPEITVTPHVAGALNPEQQAKYAAGVITRFCAGSPLEGVVDCHVGY